MLNSRTNQRGDQIVEVAIEAPDPRDERTRELLRELAKLHPEDPRAKIWEQGLREDRFMAKKSKAAYMISAVAEQYAIHPQTLRLYEREGLLKPSRSEGNTRLYTDDDLERLEVILHLTRDLGVNLAGVEIILNMREKMGEMQSQIQEFIATLNRELAARTARASHSGGAQRAASRHQPARPLRRPTAARGSQKDRLLTCAAP